MKKKGVTFAGLLVAGVFLATGAQSAFISFAATPQRSAAGSRTAPKSEKPSPNSNPEFGGTYDKLTPNQRRLVDEWFERYKQRTGKDLKPENAYGLVSVSIRTTFEAVTNALERTHLTDSHGKSLGTALDVVQAVETVNGEIPGAPGDNQFRMYVAMKPDARHILDECREFIQKGDNTIFHNGYPVNFRQGGKEPTIQISMSRDGTRADIDVDYRSSKFPFGLFNGHLTAANSDIRAGNNYRGHLRRWNGLANWWRDLFGLPVEGDRGFVPEPERGIPKQPRLTATASLADVVNDYLGSWLVERKPNLAVAYVSKRAFACINPGSKKNSIPAGEANAVPRKLWDDLEETNRVLGRPAKLQDVVEKVELVGPEFLPMPGSENLPFELVQIPEDVAAELDCSGTSGPALPEREYGEYFGSSFRIKAPEGEGAVLLLIWEKENGYWKIVNLQIDAVNGKGDPMPDQTAAQVAPPPEEHPGNDPEMAGQIEEFFETLFIKRDADKAFLVFAPSAYRCAGDSSASGRKFRGVALRAMLKDIVHHAAIADDLGKIIESYNPENPNLTYISHANDKAYLLGKIPQDELKGFSCVSRPKYAPAAATDNLPPGNYWATFFKMVQPGEEPAGLGLLWAEENGTWKVVAFRMDQP